MLLFIILATLSVSAISAILIILFSKHIQKRTHYLISFAAGVLVSVSFFGLIPESIHLAEKSGIGEQGIMIAIVAGIVSFFLIERFLHWHHCGKHTCKRKTIGTLNLVGDAFHNALDGFLIAGAFLINPLIGLSTTLAVIFHEIPQEIADIAILLHSGMTKRQVLIANLLVSLTAVMGGIVGFFLFSSVEGILPFVIAFTAGGFLYIALSDIIPELHEHSHHKQIIPLEALIFIGSIVATYILLLFLGH